MELCGAIHAEHFASHCSHRLLLALVFGLGNVRAASVSVKLVLELWLVESYCLDMILSLHRAYPAPSYHDDLGLAYQA